MDFQSALQDLFKRVHTTSEVQEELLSVLSGDSGDNIQKSFMKPHKVALCPDSGKEFLCCDFNSWQSSFRSPYSNQYIPNTNGPVPSRSLREIEIKANSMFEDYKDSFYKNGICSVYIRETSERSYAVCFVVQKKTENGSSDVCHLIDLLYDGHHKILFKLVTKLLVKVNVKGFQYQGSMSRSVEEGFNRLEDSKQELAFMIKMIENIEGTLKRVTINFIQSKTVQVCNECRFFSAKEERNRDFAMIKRVWNSQNKLEFEENKLSD